MSQGNMYLALVSVRGYEFWVCLWVYVQMGYIQVCLSVVCQMVMSLGVCPKGVYVKEYIRGFRICPRMSNRVYVQGMSFDVCPKDVCPKESVRDFRVCPSVFAP